jgi:hypothetical protein
MASSMSSSVMLANAGDPKNPGDNDRTARFSDSFSFGVCLFLAVIWRLVSFPPPPIGSCAIVFESRDPNRFVWPLGIAAPA